MGEASTAWVCPQCGRKFRLQSGQDAPELCPNCAKKFTLPRLITREESDLRKRPEKPPEPAVIKPQKRHIEMTTADSVEGFRIAESMGIIAADCVYGVNALREFIASFTDFFGGRSGQFQKVLKDLRATCLDELAKEAAARGANAVIAVRLNYQQISGKNLSMLMLVASGTAVIIEPIDASPRQ